MVTVSARRAAALSTGAPGRLAGAWPGQKPETEARLGHPRNADGAWGWRAGGRFLLVVNALPLFLFLCPLPSPSSPPSPPPPPPSPLTGGSKDDSLLDGSLANPTPSRPRGFFNLGRQGACVVPICLSRFKNVLVSTFGRWSAVGFKIKWSPMSQPLVR